MTTKPDEPDRAVEAATKAIEDVVVGFMWPPTLAKAAVDAAAPHITEQFIDGLTDNDWWTLWRRLGSPGNVTLREVGRGFVKRLIPTPEGNKK